MHLRNRPRTTHPHRRAQGVCQVLGSIVGLCGPEQDLPEGRPSSHFDPRAPWERGVRGCHPPVEPSAGSFLRAGQRRPQHHRIGTAGHSLRHVASHGDPAVRHHRHVASGAATKFVPRRGGIRHRRRLGHPHTQHAPARAGRTRPHADEQSGRTSVQQRHRRVVPDAVSHHDRHVHPVDEIAHGDGAAP